MPADAEKAAARSVRETEEEAVGKKKDLAMALLTTPVMPFALCSFLLRFLFWAILWSCEEKEGKE
jgi:hypothetical protein